MHRLGIAIVSGVVAACAQIAGIDETTKDPPSASLTFERWSVGTTVIKAPLDMTANEASYLIPSEVEPDGFAVVPAALLGSTWSADVPEGTPLVRFELPDYPDPLQRLWSLPARDVLGTFTVLEHPNAVAASTSASISVLLTTQPAWLAADSLTAFTVGSWTTRAMPELAAADGATQVGPVTYMFTSSTSLSGRPHQLLTTDDVYLMLRYSGNQLVGRYTAAPFNQTEQTQLIGELSSVPLDQTLDVRIDPVAIGTRFTTVRPAVTGLVMNWSLVASPGAMIGLDTGPRLHAGSVGVMDPGTVTAPYGNPFASRGWPTVLTFATQQSRTYTPPALALPVTLVAAMSERVVPTPGLELRFGAGLPVLVSLDDKPLSSDGMMITKPTAPVVITIVTDVMTNTTYQIVLCELVPNTAMPPTALICKGVMRTLGLEPRVILPPSVFEVGKHYSIRAQTTSGGLPSIGSGDLRDATLPSAVSRFDSGVFVVMP